MATLNFAHREIIAKVVYFGAPSAGSSTNLRKLYELLPTSEKGQLHRFGPPDEEDDIWYFECVPETERSVRDFRLRLRVYAIPGGMTEADYRREVLRGTDAVIFVADARKGREAKNLDCLLDLEALLKYDGIEMAALPMVIQVNHTDHETARPIEQVVFDLNPFGFPVVEAVARDQKGVLEAHKEVFDLTLERIRDTLTGKDSVIRLTAVHDAREPTEDDTIAAHRAAVDRLEHQRSRHDQAEVVAWQELHAAGEIALAFQPADFEGTTPRLLLGAEIVGEDIELDLIMEQDTGGSPRRLRVTLLNHPLYAPATSATTSTPATPRRPDSIFDDFPDSFDLPPAPPPKNDFPPVYYGLTGLAMGVVIGLLIGVISFL
jgi:hypothetical protein